MGSQQRKPLLGNGSLNTPVAMQWLTGRDVVSAVHTDAVIEELLLVAFSVRSVSRLCNEDQLSLSVSPNKVRVECQRNVGTESAGGQL